jgi:hypothetical protein
MSGKKNLLNEAQVRKFMKLANLRPFASSFVNEMDYRDDDDNLDELRTGRTGALGPKSGRANPGHGRGQGEAADGSLFQEAEADPGALEDYAAGDLERGHPGEAADDELEAGGELEADIEMEPEVGADEGRMVSVDDFLAALETALEDAIGDEVEIDSDEVEAEEEVDDFAPEGEEVVADVEMGDEEAMQEGWEHPKSATGAANTHKGSKQHPDHRNKKNSKGGLASQGPGLVKEEDDDDDEGSKKGEYKRRGKSAEHPEGKKAGDVGGHYKAYEKKDESVGSTNDLVEEITKRVAARILKSALRK